MPVIKFMSGLRAFTVTELLTRLCGDSKRFLAALGALVGVLAVNMTLAKDVDVLFGVTFGFLGVDNFVFIAFDDVEPLCPSLGECLADFVTDFDDLTVD